MPLHIRVDSLDKLFSRLIRLRANQRCERCHSYQGYAGLQAAHFHGRRKKSVRWDTDNALGLCFGCHQYFHENPEEFRAFMKIRLGEDGLNNLDARARTPNRYLDKEAVRLWLEQEVKKQEAQNE